MEYYGTEGSAGSNVDPRTGLPQQRPAAIPETPPPAAQDGKHWLDATIALSKILQAQKGPASAPGMSFAGMGAPGPGAGNPFGGGGLLPQMGPTQRMGKSPTDLSNFLNPR